MSRSVEALALEQPPVSRAASLPGGLLIAARAGRVLAWFHGDGLCAFDVLALSPHGVWLDAAHALGNKQAPRAGSGRLWLDANGFRIGPLEVVLEQELLPASLPGECSTRVCVARLVGPLAELRQLARYMYELSARGLCLPPERPETSPECVTDGVVIAELLELFAREQVPGFVRTHAGKLSTRIRAFEHGTLTWDGDTSRWCVPTHVEFPYLHAVYEVPVVLAAERESMVPDWITKRMRRASRRAAAPAGLVLQFAHPLVGELVVQSELRDLSRSGLSFEADAVEQLLSPGLTLKDVVLSGGALCTSFSAVVRSVRPSNEQRAVIGLAIEPESVRDPESFRRIVELALYPTTHTRAADAWPLHESSGYLSLSGKQPADFQRLKRHFTQAAHKLEAAPDLATVAYWPRQGRIEATVSNFRIYESSWLACQLSKLKTADALSGSRGGIRDMYMRIYESAQADADTRWLLTYVQDKAPRWSREIQVTVAERYVSTGEGCLVPFRAVECAVAPGEARSVRSHVRVAPADPVTARAAMRDLHRVRPAQYLDALDLTESRWDLSGASARWQSAGLERQRQLLIAHEGTQRVALAVLELAELGVHIYGLLDCVRLYPLRPGGERAFSALMGEAQRWFAERGRRKFVYLEEFDSELSSLGSDMRDLGRATLSMLSIDRVPELLARASDLASRRPPRERANTDQLTPLEARA